MPVKTVRKRVAARKKIVKVYPRELLRIEGMSPEKFDKLRTYSAKKREQIVAEIREQAVAEMRERAEKRKQIVAEMQEQAVAEMRERAVVKMREQTVAEDAQNQRMIC